MTRTLHDLSRDELAALGREWLLHGHLQDRVGMPLVLEWGDREEMQAVAIDEWMAASPVYSRRMQQLLGFEGTGVDTILKNLQLDIGAPHEFMDFRYRLVDAEHAEFWLAHCGALMDVEPMGRDWVHGMCHTIEDPTFDATATATNPGARVRPIHRPPRSPAGRTPHCHWRIDVSDEANLVEHADQRRVAAALAAQLPVEPPPQRSDHPDDGRDDYRGEFDPDFRLEQLSRPALVAALEEFAVQSHLLLRSYLLAVERRVGLERAAAIAARVVAGWGALTAERLRAALDLPATSDGLAQLLALHPFAHPGRYVSVEVGVPDTIRVEVTFPDCVAAAEPDGLTSRAALLRDGGAVLEAVLQGFDPRVRVRPEPGSPAGAPAFVAVLDPAESPAAPTAELELARLSTGARFRFRGAT